MTTSISECFAYIISLNDGKKSVKKIQLFPILDEEM